MITLYHVRASRGSYDDYREWNVISFLEESDAQKYIDLHCELITFSQPESKYEPAYAGSYYRKKDQAAYDHETWNIECDSGYESWEEMLNEEKTA